MMGVVNLHHEVGDAELQLVSPQPTGFVLGSKAMTRPEVKQDVGGLRDQPLARLENRGCKWRMYFTLAREQPFDRRTAAFASDVDVLGACLFEREADKLAATLDCRPIVKLVAHRFPVCHSIIAF